MLRCVRAVPCPNGMRVYRLRSRADGMKNKQRDTNEWDSSRKFSCIRTPVTLKITIIQ
jgi:hypothetical protein